MSVDTDLVQVRAAVLEGMDCPASVAPEGDVAIEQAAPDGCIHQLVGCGADEPAIPRIVRHHRSSTSLSEHEMAGSHKDIEHLSVYVLAPLKTDPSRKLLLWTTTPMDDIGFANHRPVPPQHAR